MKKVINGKNKMYILKSTTLGCVLDEILNAIIEYMIQYKYNETIDQKRYLKLL